MDSDWRTPSSSEAELISEWTQKVLRADSMFLTKGNIIELVIVGVLTLLGFISNVPIEIVLVLGGMFGVPMIIVIILLQRSDLRKRKQLFSGDYMILDSFVISKSVFRHFCYVYVKIPNGMDRDIKVSSSIYNAVSENTRGYLVRYGKNEPVHKGVAKEFFPAIPVEY